MRIFAAFTAESQTDFIDGFFVGKKISDMKDNRGNKMKDEKYAFRCFLLRLGFIGEEYKVERKILLKNLTGSSAFKNGENK